uniref:Uncharacterized protein n=1 Tax=Nelumbo nucifera TaxID=4432 RepID=A0A822YRV3_NELNU|nr:TPA_asm: hypothetical protein HUJ06_005897 [Nelumbo nucifera]
MHALHPKTRKNAKHKQILVVKPQANPNKKTKLNRKKVEGATKPTKETNQNQSQSAKERKKNRAK